MAASSAGQRPDGAHLEFTAHISTPPSPCTISSQMDETTTIDLSPHRPPLDEAFCFGCLSMSPDGLQASVGLDNGNVAILPLDWPDQTEAIRLLGLPHGNWRPLTARIPAVSTDTPVATSGAIPVSADLSQANSTRTPSCGWEWHTTGIRTNVLSVHSHVASGALFSAK
jgi:hypothetical protein